MALQGLDPDPEIIGPPQSEEEVQQRMGGWQKFTNALASDPTLAMGLLRFGTQMMQPIAPGQSRLGHLGASLEDSVNYAATAKQQQDAQARQEAESVSKRGLEDAQAAHATAQAGDVTARMPGAVAIQDALVRLYGSHSAAYEAASKVAQAKADMPRQILHSTTVQNADGTQTIVNTHAVNGKLYIESYTPPRFTDETLARAQAQKDVDKITPFFGQAPYQGTKADEIKRRTESYLNGKRVIAGPTGVISPEQFDQLDQQPNTSPKQLNKGERGMQKQVALTDEERAADAAHDQSPANLDELKTTLANAKDPKIRNLLQNELDRIQNAGKQTSPAAGPVQVVWNPDGTLRRADSQPAKPVPDQGFAAGVLGTPTSRAAQVAAERTATATAKKENVMKIQKEFETDRASLAPQALLAKYGQGDVLTPEQRAVLFKIRNAGSRYSR